MASIFVLYGESSEENADIYAYACEAVIAFLINLLLGLIVALVFGRFFEGIVFILGFWLLRRYTGGYHAKTHFNCILAFSCILVSAMLFLSVATWLGFAEYLAVVVAGLALVGIISIAVKERVMRLSDVTSNLEVKLQGIWLAFGMFLFCIVDLYIISSQIGLSVALSMFSVFGSMAYAMVYKHFLTGGGEEL